jgi:hypothetical protein
MIQLAGVRLLFIGAVLLLPMVLGAGSVQRHSHYLFVWAMEVQHPDASVPAPVPGKTTLTQMMDARRDDMGLGEDFISVFDVGPDAHPFGKLVAMLPAGEAAMAHHTNYAMPPDGRLYANDWMANRTYVFNLRDPLRPSVQRQFGNVGAYGWPHSFVHLANGNTLATFQYAGGFNHAPGGLVEFDPGGGVVTASSAADNKVDPNIRPYSLAVVEKLDRVVTGSADMMASQVSRVVQVWRLRDLKLLKTIVLPAAPYWYSDPSADSSEPRLLADGKTVVVPTFNCGLLLMRNLAADAPTLQHIYDFGYRACAVPVVVGNYLVETMQSGHAVVSLDMSNPEHPHEVGRILLGPDDAPHWIAVEPGGDRLVITGVGALNTRVLFATINRQTGELKLDPRSIDMTRTWPDGWKGSAIPHGAVFNNE